MQGKVIRTIVDDIYDEGKMVMAVAMDKDGIPMETIARYASVKRETVEKWIFSRKTGGELEALEKNTYFQRKLLEQREEIAEKILLEYGGLDDLETLEYITGLPQEKAENIIRYVKEMLGYRDGFSVGVTGANINSFRQFLKKDAMNDERYVSALKETFGVDDSVIASWRKNPDKYAVMECLANGFTHDAILKVLRLSAEEIDKWELEYYRMKRAEGYKPIFQLKLLSNEELREQYWTKVRVRGDLYDRKEYACEEE